MLTSFAVPEPRDTRTVAQRQALRAVVGAACDAGGIAVLAYLFVSRVFYNLFDVDRLILVVVVAGFIVLRRLTPRLDPRVTLASFALLAASGAGLMLLLALGVNVVDPMKSFFSPVRIGLFTILDRTAQLHAIQRLDDRYGYVNVPNAVGQEAYGGFPAIYTIDGDGHRTTPSPASPRGTVVFLGDSFTFGWGVEDDEAYPSVLATEHWTDLRIINAGVSGWGLTQYYLALTDMLAHPPLPDVVIVSMIADDIRRSHLRSPEITGQRRRLEFIDGVFVPRDLRYRRVRETPELLEEEARLALATIEAMTAATRKKGVTFGVILLGSEDPSSPVSFPPDLIYALGRDDVATLDLTRLGQTHILYDMHPDPAGHRTIAAAIASSLLTPLVYRRASGQTLHDSSASDHR